MALLILITYTLAMLALGWGACLLLHSYWCERPVPMLAHPLRCLCTTCYDDELRRRVEDKEWVRRQETLEAAVDEVDKL